MRIVRIIIGLVAIGYAFYSGNAWFYLGVIPLGIGLLNWCPLSKMFGGCSDGSCADGSCCSTTSTSKESEACCSEDDDSCCAPTAKKEELCCTPIDTKAVKKENITAFAAAPQELPDVSEGITTILILGTGCAKCIALKKAVDEAVADKKEKYVVRKVEDIEIIMSYGVMSTPGLVIDGKVISSGKSYTKTEVEKILDA